MLKIKILIGFFLLLYHIIGRSNSNASVQSNKITFQITKMYKCKKYPSSHLTCRLKSHKISDCVNRGR